VPEIQLEQGVKVQQLQAVIVQHLFQVSNVLALLVVLARLKGNILLLLCSFKYICDPVEELIAFFLIERISDQTLPKNLDLACLEQSLRVLYYYKLKEFKPFGHLFRVAELVDRTSDHCVEEIATLTCVGSLPTYLLELFFRFLGFTNICDASIPCLWRVRGLSLFPLLTLTFFHLTSTCLDTPVLCPAYVARLARGKQLVFIARKG
jgi:hypothetical protein